MALLALVVGAWLLWPRAEGLPEGDEDYETPVVFREGRIEGRSIVSSEASGASTRREARTLEEVTARTVTEEERARAEGETRPLDEPIPEGAVDRGPGRDFLERYGGRSGRLSALATPAWATPVTPNWSDDPEPPRLVAWVPSVRVLAGSAMPIRVVLRDPSGPVTPARLEVILHPAGRAEPVQRLALAPPTTPSDEVDFEAAFEADPSAWPATATGEPLALSWLVVAEGSYAGEPYERRAGGLLFVHEPGGTLRPETVRFARTREGIELRVDATIETEGDYWAYADLWGGLEADAPIAFGQLRMEGLRPGPTTLRLLFGGAILAEAASTAPTPRATSA